MKPLSGLANLLVVGCFGLALGLPCAASELDHDALNRFFGAGASGADPPPPPPPGEGDLAKRFALIGTLVAEKGPSYAILQDKRGRTGDQLLVRSGGVLLDSVRIHHIQRRWISLAPEGAALERIGLDLEAPENRPVRALARAAPDRTGGPVPGIRLLDEGRIQIDPAARDRHLANLPQLLRSARAEAVPSAGGLGGFRLTTIRPDSVVAALGLTIGDVITAVDGRPLDDLARVAELLRDIRTLDALELTVERHGRSRTLRYEIGA